jgi:hypothetical protein
MQLKAGSLFIPFVFHTLSGSASAATISNGLYKSCALTSTGPTVSLYRSAKINDSFRYAVQIGTGPQQPVFDGEDEGDRGASVKATCVGPASARALVMQGEFFGSAYPKGLVVVWNPFLREIERINFSEKSPPSHVYLDKTGTRVVVPNKNGETAASYIVYIYAASTKQTTTIALDSLPSKQSKHELFYTVGKRGK